MWGHLTPRYENYCLFYIRVFRFPLLYRRILILVIILGVYLHVPELFDISLPKVQDICISYQGVVAYREYNRLILSGTLNFLQCHQKLFSEQILHSPSIFFDLLDITYSPFIVYVIFSRVLPPK